MPVVEYIQKAFHPKTLKIISQANAIISELKAQGFTLTLRQIYYQFVARKWLENSEREYKRLGVIINDARMAGHIDWLAVEDRTRWLREQSHWENPRDILNSCVADFRIDRWETQAYRPEVWIEKDALVGVIEGVCLEYDVPYFACRGYVSQSELWRAGERFAEYADDGQIPVVFHLGDHDPSGIDMTRDNEERLSTFSGLQPEPDGFRVQRLALNMEQIRQFDPPPNPAKLTDKRAAEYVQAYGSNSWELDALNPNVIVTLIRHALESLIDDDEWSAALEREEQGRDHLRRLAEEA